MQGQGDTTYENIKSFLNSDCYKDKKVYKELIRKMKEFLFKLQSDDGVTRSKYEKFIRDNFKNEDDLQIKALEIDRLQKNIEQDSAFIAKQESQIKAQENYLREMDGGRSVISYFDDTKSEQSVDFREDSGLVRIRDTSYLKNTDRLAKTQNTFIEDNLASTAGFGDGTISKKMKVSQMYECVDVRNHSLKDVNGSLRIQQDILQNSMYSDERLENLLKMYNSRASGDYKKIGKEVQTILKMHMTLLENRLQEKSSVTEFKREDSLKETPLGREKLASQEVEISRLKDILNKENNVIFFVNPKNS